MQIDLDFDPCTDGADDAGTLRARVTGRIGWNDRVRLAALTGRLARTGARLLTFDVTACEEQDDGAVLGLRGTAERIALSEGLRFAWCAS